MKRIFGLIAAVSTCALAAASLASCKVGSGEKFGFIFLHDSKSTYDNNFIEAAKKACNDLGVQAVLKTNIPEGEECYAAAKDLVAMGCKGVFADSFGHEDFLIKAAKDYKNVQFAHATGTKAHTEKLDNFQNAFANIYEGRYIAGVAAGLKLNDMMAKDSTVTPLMGYVGAFPYAEVVSGYTAFFLGAKSVCPNVQMKVRYTNSWYDENAEKSTCETLINKDNCVLISQHADSQGAPGVCESKNVPNVFYNGENKELSNSYLTASRINWVPFFKYFIENTLNGTDMSYDWVGTLANGAVEYYAPNEKIAAEGTAAKLNEVKAKLQAGTLHVFDTTTFTVSKFGDGITTFFNLNAKVDADGRVTSYKADVDSDAAYQGDTEVVDGNIFKESVFRSAPYFDLRIDGITEL